MRKRLTLEIEQIKGRANHFLTHSENDKVEQRKAIHGFVTILLMDANNYSGYQCLREDQVPPGHSFGVSYDENNKPTFHDESRTNFY